MCTGRHDASFQFRYQYRGFWGTHIRPLLAVRAHVPGEMTLPSEPSPTLRAYVRFLPRVDAFVSGQFTCPGEALLAHVTLVPLLLVGQHVSVGMTRRRLINHRACGKYLRSLRQVSP